MRRVLGLMVVVLGLATAAACGSGSSAKPPSSSTSSTTTTAGGSTTATTASRCTTNTTVAGSNAGPETNPPGDIPDNQAFVAYSPADKAYSVKVPEGWARTETTDGARFSDKLNTIDIKVVASASAPTVETVKSDEVPKLQQTVPCFALRDVTTVSRTSGAVVLTTYGADSEPDAVTAKTVRDDVERYEYWKAGRTVVLTLSGPAGSDNVDPWKIVTDSLAWQ